jgi:predicted RNA-binding Zn-ribbon protein involved in translation (DUF1610 family)/predicted nucleic acid-binding protein
MYAGRGQTAPFIGTLMRQNRYLSEDQVRQVLRMVNREPREDEDREIGRLAIQHRFLTEGQWRECLATTQGNRRRGGASACVEEVAVEKGYLAESQAGALLDMLRRNRRGVLALLDEGLRPPSAERAAELWARLRGPDWTHSPLAGAAFVTIIVLSMIAAVRLSRGSLAPPETLVRMRCRDCGTYAKQEDTETPALCPRCGKVELYYVKRCDRCREPEHPERLREFLLNTEFLRTQGIVCPYCKAKYAPPRARMIP